MLQGPGYLRVRFYLLEHPPSMWSARVLGHRHKECYPPGHGGTGWNMDPAKAQFWKNLRWVTSEPMTWERRQGPNTGKGFLRVTHSCSSRQARGIKIRIKASLGREGKSVLPLPIREQGKLLWEPPEAAWALQGQFYYRGLGWGCIYSECCGGWRLGDREVSCPTLSRRQKYPIFVLPVIDRPGRLESILDALGELLCGRKITAHSQESRVTFLAHLILHLENGGSKIYLTRSGYGGQWCHGVQIWIFSQRGNIVIISKDYWGRIIHLGTLIR